jgi:DnaJ-class molecular chaperone
MSDYYSILGVDKNASDDDIKKAYKKLSLKYHPDRPNGDTEKFKEINEAYETLSDPDKKSIHDNPHINHHNQQNGFPGGDIFEHLMRNMNVNINMNNHQNQNIKRTNHHHKINISLRDAHYGLTKTLKISIIKQCFDCKKSCYNCNGNGIITKIQQTGPFMQQFQSKCNTCNGVGVTIVKNINCNSCSGNGILNEEETIKLDIRKNINNNEQFCFKDLGEQILKKGEQPGDLIITIFIYDENEYFQRENNHLIYKSKLSLVESLLGKEIVVPHFDSNITINTNIFGTIDFNKRYHIKDKGLGNQGDLILVFEYEYKDIQLSEDKRDKLQNCFKELNLI